MWLGYFDLRQRKKERRREDNRIEENRIEQNRTEKKENMESRVDSSSIFAYIYNVLTSDLSDRSCTRSTECTETDGTTRETHYAHT